MTKLLAATTLLAGLLAACGANDDAPPDPEPIAAIEVTSPVTTLAPGQTLQLTATAFDADGDVLPGRAITWASRDRAVATVSTDGLVTALAAGDVVITATGEGALGEASLEVREHRAEVASIELDPTELTLVEGATTQLVAIVRDADGEELEGRTITWESTADQVATVSATGEVTAVAIGGATVIARCEGHEAYVALAVEAAPPPVAWIELDVDPAVELSPGGTLAVGVIAYADDGEVLEGRTVTWSSDEPSVASVSATGLVEAHDDGAAVITAEVEGKTAALTVTVVSVASIALDPIEAVIVVDETLALVAEPRDAAGYALDRVVTWASDHPEYAAVDEHGVVTGVAEGDAVITATSEGVTASVRVSVSRWQARSLVTIDGAALPATLVEFTRTVNGIERTFRFRASQGVLRTRPIDHRYELWVIGLTSDGAGAVPFGYRSDGTYVEDAAGTGYDFHPANGAATFAGATLPDGGLSVVWQPDPRSAPATLAFTPPAS